MNGVSFKIKKGEIFGLLGPNGAGKTTTINILSTFVQPTTGDAYVNGHSWLDKERHYLIKGTASPMITYQLN